MPVLLRPVNNFPDQVIGNTSEGKYNTVNNSSSGKWPFKSAWFRGLPYFHLKIATSHKHSPLGLHEARPRRVVWLWEPEYDLYYTQWLPQGFWREFYQRKVGKGGGKCWASVVDLDCTHSKNNDPALGSCWSTVWGAVGTLNNNKEWLILPLHFLWYPLYYTKTSLQ